MPDLHSVLQNFPPTVLHDDNCLHPQVKLILASLHSAITLLLAILQAYSNSMAEYGYTMPTLWHKQCVTKGGFMTTLTRLSILKPPE